MNVHLSNALQAPEPPSEAPPASVDTDTLAAFFRPRPTILACLTLYNEPADALAQTLAGLVRNQLDLKRRCDAKVPVLAICIMLDGEGTLDATTAVLLSKLGFDCAPQTLIEDQDQALFVSQLTVSANELLVRLGGQALPWNGMRVRLALCKKRLNRGKLDSHVWFFNAIAPFAEPEFIVQIDAGSVPDDTCLKALLDHMDRNRDCGAAATHIMTPAGEGRDILLDWQHNDFLWSKVTDWAIGQAVDYIEVVPGQCCILRWSSLRQPAPTGETKTTALDVYLGGVAADSLLERNLYLAEDRVLGLAMVEATGGSVHYVPTARVKTDPCMSLDELLRQRRRWINSTVAARLVACSRLPDILSSRLFGWQRKVSLLVAVVFGLYQVALLLTLPAMSITLFAWGVDNFASLFLDHADVASPKWLAAGAFLLGWSGLLLSMRQGLAKNGFFKTWHGAALLGLLALSVAGNGLALLTTPDAAVAVGVTAILVSLAVLRIDRSTISYWHRWMPLQLLMSPAVNLYLTSYAFANLSDVSWGTKGLNRSGERPAQQKRWQRVRNAFLIVWIALSAALAFWLLAAPAQMQSMIGLSLIGAFCLPATIAAFLSLARDRPRMAPRASVQGQEIPA